MAGMTVEQLFAQGQDAFVKITKGEDEDCGKEDTVKAAISLLERLQTQLAVEAVFSRNEEVEDIATENLPMLATDCYLAMILLKLPFRNPRQRLSTLERADALFSCYLDLCERLHILQDEDLQAWRSAAEEQDSGRGDLQNRERKVSRYKRQRVTEGRLKSLTDELEAIKAAAQQTKDKMDDDGLMMLEAISRERSLIMLESLARQALDELEGLAKEKPMLKMMAQKMGLTADGDSGEAGDSRTKNRDTERDGERKGLQVTHITKVGGELQMRREEVKANVFRPTVAPPTMTLEEFAAIEMKDAMERQEREKSAPQPDRRIEHLIRDGEEDNEELVDKAADKDREWDDWKDEHPRGAGNKAGKII